MDNAPKIEWYPFGRHPGNLNQRNIMLGWKSYARAFPSALACEQALRMGYSKIWIINPYGEPVCRLPLHLLNEHIVPYKWMYERSFIWTAEWKSLSWVPEAFHARFPVSSLQSDPPACVKDNKTRPRSLFFSFSPLVSSAEQREKNLWYLWHRNIIKPTALCFPLFNKNLKPDALACVPVVYF